MGTMRMHTIRLILTAWAVVLLTSGSAIAQTRGVLLLAHGGREQWNAHVMKLASDVDRMMPTEVAFGMATRANIQRAVDRLRSRGVDKIVAVPLFISSWSSVITSTEYLLGQRPDAPPELATYARMNHGAGASGGDHASSHGGIDHAARVTPDPKSPVVSPIPIRMTPALNDHSIVADILTDRARSISRNPPDEAVVIVAHGPVGDEENRRWLADMGSLAARVQNAAPFSAVEYLTLRDDAPKPVRDQATAELRAVATKHLSAGRRVLVVPLLVSFGGIEKGLRERLEGLAYTMPAAALAPDDRLVDWVAAMAKQR
jgi:sirohydrochlorin cobaltochelatase